MVVIRAAASKIVHDGHVMRYDQTRTDKRHNEHPAVNLHEHSEQPAAARTHILIAGNQPLLIFVIGDGLDHVQSVWERRVRCEYIHIFAPFLGDQARAAIATRPAIGSFEQSLNEEAAERNARAAPSTRPDRDNIGLVLVPCAHLYKLLEAFGNGTAAPADTETLQQGLGKT